ncbi:MAG: glycosyl transferase group 1 [Gammaproteobacteria bacterium]|jgi:glycosyltransferase involved in cell wall biosynthesis|nr:glycosyl transferase group 1 [Gammaproteobacteria bacterium]
MKIGIMLRSLSDVGGPGEYSRSLLNALLRLDRVNEYYLFVHAAALAERYREFPNAHPVVLTARSKLLFDQIAVPRAVRRYGCDVVINLKHSVPLFTGAPAIFVMHGADWLAFPQNYYLFDRLYHKVSLPFFCRKAARIISVSQDATRIAVDRLNLPPSKVATVYHGFRTDFQRIEAPERLARVRARYKLPERFILYVGRIYPMKNVRGLVEAFAKLRDRIPHSLVICGIKHYKTEPDFAAIEQHSLHDRVIPTGFVEEEDLPALYSMADAFVLPSLYEGFGIPLLEAMACGCPIVTSTQGSCPEVVDGAGVLVNPRDPADIAEGIYKVLADRELAAGLVRKGYQRVAQFSWEKCARETLDVIASVARTGHATEARLPDRDPS